jgi:DNA-binding phage protein
MLSVINVTHINKKRHTCKCMQFFSQKIYNLNPEEKYMTLSLGGNPSFSSFLSLLPPEKSWRG